MKNAPTRELAQALFELTDGKSETETAETAKEFISLLAKKKMIGSADEIISLYRTIHNKAHGIIEATVTLTNRLDEAAKLNLRETLKKKYGAQEVHILEKVDARLVGGMKIRIADTVYDMSLKNSLNQLQAQLTA